MGLFKKNPNEAAYHDGKKHFLDVFKSSGNTYPLEDAPQGAILWKHPAEDFNTKSSLTVDPGEEALFVDGGKVKQVFENGNYRLETRNYPFISRLRNALSGGISVYNCKVYFVRKADSEEIFWGTDSPIVVRDKVWGVVTDIKARGAYKFRVTNSTVFLEKLIGAGVADFEQKELLKYFRNEFQGKIKSAVSKFLNSLTQEMIGIDQYLDDLSTKIEPTLDEILGEYGLKCVRFTLSGMDVDTTKYDKLDESQIGLIERTRGFQGDKAGLDILGADWAKVQQVQIMKDVANNPNSGGVAGIGAGLGMGLGTIGAFGTMAQNTFTQQPAGVPTQQPAQQQTAATQEDPMETLAKLKKMLDAGLIDQEEFNSKKAEILGRM